MADLEEMATVTAPEVSYLRNQLTRAEEGQGWKLLWDGKTTAGWRGYKSEGFPEKGWSMHNGELIVEASAGGESSNGGDIVTTRQFRNFILEMDFEGEQMASAELIDSESSIRIRPSWLVCISRKPTSLRISGGMLQESR